MKPFLFLYNLLFPIALLLLLPGALLRMARRGNYAHKFGQRFGWYSRRTRARLRSEQGRWIWIHAVSVGEVLIALRFVRHLRKERDIPVILSTTTSTGFALANQHSSSSLEVIYHPVDFYFSVRRILGIIRPRALVLVEAEIWPNLASLAKQAGAKVLLINARLSQRSERRYRALRPLASRLFSLPHEICLQDPGDLPRFLGLGADEGRLHVTGSIKFDPAQNGAVDGEECRRRLEALGVGRERRILLGASTHPGEEAILARVFRSLRTGRKDLFLVLVPRHVERAEQVQGELEGMGFSVRRRSGNPHGECDLLLVDTTGELRSWTETASVVFVGKSLSAKGGQNPAEAVAAGKPVVFGPHMQNFQALVDGILAAEGARVARDEAELGTICAELFDDPSAASEMARRAASALAPHHLATDRTVARLLALLGEPTEVSAPSHG